MRIVIDTNAYTALARGDERAIRVFRRASEIHLPVPVMAELRFGFVKGTRRSRNEARLVAFAETGRVTVLPCDEQTTHFYAQLKLQLVKQGTPIPINDVWIAALASQHDLLLYSSDRHFDHIPQLGRVSVER